jgi:thiamine transport system permease protein
LTKSVEIGTWNCPIISMSSTDSVVIRVYCRIYDDGNWSLIRTFITRQLGATQLNNSTWTVHYCLEVTFDEHKYCYTYYTGDTLSANFTNFSEVDGFAWTSGATLASATSAICTSFVIATFVAIVDILAGLPMAWLIARGQSRWLSILDTFSDIPFIIPTATLGYSLLLFWSDTQQGISSLFGSSLVSPGWILVILLHFAFSYPVVVRVMVGALLDYKLEYEQAARTLGAAPFTADRTVTFSILKPSLIASFVLAFARSISETGATMMVAGAFLNGPIFIKNYLGQEGPLVFVSFILIVLSSTVFIAIRLLGPRLKLPIKKVWPTAERKLSSSAVTSSRNSLTLLIFFALILIPSLFVALPAFEALFENIFLEALAGAEIWGEYWQSIFLTYSLGVVVTLLNVVIGLPMAIVVARRKFGELPSMILDVLVNIPLIVPSVALGVSLAIFWNENFAFIPEIWLLVFAHLAITYPYFVRSMSAAVERINIELEEAAKTLGAKPFSVFRTIVFPLTKYSILSGAIMVFTRSVSETGATMVVSNLVTAPVLLVDWVKSGVPTATLGLGCGFLIVFSFIILLVLRLVVKRRETY